MNAVGEVLDRKDRPAYVTFHKVPKEDKAASLAAGRYVAKDVDFVHVTPPYSKDIMKFKVADWFLQMENDLRNGRIPQEWVELYRKKYQAWQIGQEIPLDGFAIRGWSVLSPAQQETLIHMNVLTVEDLAAINDEGIKRLGMGLGSSVNELRLKAKAWLASASERGPLAQKVAATEIENENLKAQVATLTAQVESLLKQAQQEQPQYTQPQANEEIGVADILDEPVDERKQLVERYKAKHGKSPHPATSLDVLRERAA